MLTNRLTKSEIFQWCSIPWQELEAMEGKKFKLEIRETRADTMRELGNLMADEVAANNAKGLPTKWVLPAGPTDEYDIFVERVNRERISLKNLWIFHMDEFLDWECRPYPVEDIYESLDGTMNACFYGRIDPELNVPEEQRIWPRVSDKDYPDQLCEKLGGIDTVWAGIGAAGLVAFNEAPHAYTYRISVEEYARSKTRIVDLNEDTLVALSHRSFGGCTDAVPPKSITIGFKIMMTAKRFVAMVTTGAWKKTACRIMLFAEPTVEYPVTIVPKYVPECILYTNVDTMDHPMSHELKGW